MLISIC